MPGSIFPLEIQPRVPRQLEGLNTMAEDLVYAWDRSIRSLFHRLDRDLWDRCGHSPKLFLRRVSQQRLDDALRDRSYMEDFRRVQASYKAYHEQAPKPEIDSRFDAKKDLVAYFCLEFGLHESFPIYSGGLGILAGDHCKAASDLGLPFVAVGLLYQVGYFTQTIDGHGHQQVDYTRSHPHDLPVKPALGAAGKQLTLSLEFPERSLKVRVWTALVGHISLYLLDTNLPENSPQDRAITQQLYGGDREMRLQQELVLGIGGVRALKALQLMPTVWHINEGHAAFQLLERCLFRMREGLDFDSAMELVAAGTVFTTHTPVPAGHDIFDKTMLQRYLAPLARDLGLEFETLYALGANANGGFNMTSLALRCTRFHNGVSRVHGQVAAEMEAGIWPQIPHPENPMGYITNGVHLQTFLAREWVSLFDLRFDNWSNELLNPDYWERIEEIPHYHYWSVHKALKHTMLGELCNRLTHQHRRNGVSDAQINHMLRLVRDSERDTLVVGFARRFATYKRAGMLFSDRERLARILNDEQRPIVFIFAGKAHPNDLPGQQLIKEIHDYSMHPDFVGKVLLVEGYDMALARHLVSGVDVWLNTPDYPLEASGTSGQKAGLNGAVNLSVLDGWWAEGYNGDNGWAITPRSDNIEVEQRQREEASDLLNIIEHEVLPCYYRRNGGGYSEDWVRLSMASMKSTIPRFNAQRMLRDYIEKLYLPARRQRLKLERDGAAPARHLSQWKRQVRQAWPEVSMQLIVQPPARLYADQSMVLEVHARLNGLQATDVVLECLLGEQQHGTFSTAQQAQLQAVTTDPEAGPEHTVFRLELAPQVSGAQFYKLRLYPFSPALSHRFEMGCMIWI